MKHIKESSEGKQSTKASKNWAASSDLDQIKAKSNIMQYFGNSQAKAKPKVEEPKAAIEVNDTPSLKIDNSAKDEPKTTPNKIKKNKRSAKDKESMEMSAKTIEATPESAKKTPDKSEDTHMSNVVEEDKSNQNVQVQDEAPKPKRAGRPKKAKEEPIDNTPIVEKKRDRKTKQKEEISVEIIPEVQAAKDAITVYQTQLNNLIKAGINSNPYFDKYYGEKFSTNANSLSELVGKVAEIDLNDPETQIVFVSTLSPFIEGSELAVTPLAEIWIEKLRSISEIDCDKLKSINISEFLKINAERKSFGISPKVADTLEDTTHDCLYCWEVVNTSLIDGPVAKDISMIRSMRSFIGEKWKSLEKIIEISEKATKLSHVQKINSEIEKLDKIERKITAHLQKEAQRILHLKEKEQAENEKLLKKQQQEQEKLEKEKQRKLEIELKKQKELEEKERKKEEAAKLKQEQEEQKRIKTEELKRKKEEANAKKLEEEEKRKKELELKAQQKDNSQKKLLSFFKKQPAGTPEKITPSDDAKMSNENMPKSALKIVPQTVEIPDLTINLSKYCKYLKDKFKTVHIGECPKSSLTLPKRKDIYIEGSHRRCKMWQKVSNMISGRRPFEKDEAVIDYDMDSEEEFEEENGEDVDEDMTEEEDEDDEGNSFIVADGYLSRSERGIDDLNMENGDNGENKQGDEYKQVKQKTRDISTIVKPIITICPQIGKSRSSDSLSKNSTIISELSKYKILPARSYIKFPLVINETEFEENNQVAQNDLILRLHGTYDSKAKIIDEFNAEHPEWSKASLERQIKEISSRQKVEEHNRYRYLVDEAVIESSGVDLEKVEKVWKERYQAVMDEINKIEEEKQNKLDEIERVKQQEREKRELEKQQEREKKEAERLKLKEEKEKAKLEKKLELEQQKEQERLEREKLKEEKRLEKEREKEEKKKAKVDAKLEKQKQKTITGMGSEKSDQRSLEQTLIKKKKEPKSNEEDQADKVSPSKSESISESKVADSSNSGKRGRGRPKGSKNKANKDDTPIIENKESAVSTKTKEIEHKNAADETKSTTTKPSLLNYFSKS